MSNTSTLHLICGQAGAGKTTYAQQLEEQEFAIRFSKDEWIVTLYGRGLTLDEWSLYEPRCYACIQAVSGALLKKGSNVIWDFGFWYRKERQEAKEFADRFAANCIVHYLATPTELRRARVITRNSSLTNDSVAISAEDFEKQLSWFEPPSDEERITLRKV